jgi:hypothetical protein
MTQDEIIEMAKEAGNFKSHALPEPWIPFFVAFAKLVAAKEREACAIACETDGRDLAGLYYAGVIRARGEAV